MDSVYRSHGESPHKEEIQETVLFAALCENEIYRFLTWEHALSLALMIQSIQK